MKLRNLLSTLLFVPALVLFLSGCASNIRSAGSVLTTKQSLENGQLVPQTTFTLQDVIAFQVNITWDNLDVDAGQVDIEWNWYRDGKKIAHFENYRAYLKGAPNARVKLQPAASLGVGHFRVECVVDGKVLAAADGDIK
jgi:hypothetical protein